MRRGFSGTSTLSLPSCQGQDLSESRPVPASLKQAHGLLPQRSAFRRVYFHRPESCFTGTLPETSLSGAPENKPSQLGPPWDLCPTWPRIRGPIILGDQVIQKRCGLWAGPIPARGVLRPWTLSNTWPLTGKQPHSHSGNPGGHTDSAPKLLKH